MKPIHPEYFENATIVCGCGATYTVGSTKEKMTVELCAACHPFYTGTQTLIDAARRVEKFQEKIGKREAAAAGKVGKTAKQARRVEKKKAAGPKFEIETTKSARVKKAKKTA